MRLDPRFAANVEGLDLAVLDDLDDSVYALDEQRRLVFVNAAWDRVAEESGARWSRAWDLGASVLEATAPVLRAFYDDLFKRAADSQSPVEVDYECNSPTSVRRMRMRVARLSPGGLLVVNSTLRELAADDPRMADERRYRDPVGIIMMCAHCRRTRRADAEAWDWVPAWVADMPDMTSHGLCPACFLLHYPRTRRP